MIRPIILLSSLLGLTACATAGNGTMKHLTQSAAAQLLHPGITTREQVKESLGSAGSLRFDSGYEIWVYQYTRGLPAAIDHVPVLGLATSRVLRKTTELRLVFDPHGTLKKYLLLGLPPQSLDQRDAGDPNG